MSQYLFVYGSLRQAPSGEIHRQMCQYCEYDAIGHMFGKIYEVEQYPGLIESDRRSDLVLGELYRIHDAERLFSLLDDYEECSAKYPKPHEFIRKQSLVQRLGGKVAAWVYVYNDDVSHLTRVLSGDYASYVGDGM